MKIIKGSRKDYEGLKHETDYDLQKITPAHALMNGQRRAQICM
jgi:hypothetical protein